MVQIEFVYAIAGSEASIFAMGTVIKAEPEIGYNYPEVKNLKVNIACRPDLTYMFEISRDDIEDEARARLIEYAIFNETVGAA